MGCRLYVVDTGSGSLSFHPKVYLGLGASLARLLVGSANLTLGGLNNNVEASVALEYDRQVARDRQALKAAASTIDRFISSHPNNVLPISDVKMLLALRGQGRLRDETWTRPGPASLYVLSPDEDDTPLIQLPVEAVRSHTSLLPNGSRNLRLSATTLTQRVLSSYDLVWESKPLTRRDLSIPLRATSHATGSMSLSRGNLPPEIDPRSYFRESVFADLAWPANPRGAVEAASAPFSIYIRGVRKTRLDLTIRHSRSKRSATYLQHNAVTHLSWGRARQIIARPFLLGSTLTLYRSKSRRDYLIDIR